MSRTDNLVVSPRVCQCGEEKEYRECWNCGGDGTDGHDCGEDTCCCFVPEDNATCDICRGEGGFLVCPSCYPEAE